MHPGKPGKYKKINFQAWKKENHENVLANPGNPLKIHTKLELSGFLDLYPRKHSFTTITKNDLILNSTPENRVIAFQDRVITINIKEAQHPLK